MKTIPVCLFLIIFWFLASPVSFAQNTFEYRLHDSTDNVPYSSIETLSGQIIIGANKFYEWYQARVQLIKMTPAGTVTNTAVLDHQGQKCGLSQISQIEPGLFTLTGYVWDENVYQLWFWKSDSLFNEIQSKDISLKPYSLCSSKMKQDHDGNILCYGTVCDSAGHFNPFIYKLTGNGDSIRFKIFTDHHAFGEFDLLVKPESEGYNYIVNGYGGAGDILELDTNFSVTQSHQVPNDIFNFHNARWISAQSFILTGEYENVVTGYRNIGVEIIDKNFEATGFKSLGWNDTTLYFPGLRTNLDFICPNSVYIAGTRNFISGFEDNDSWFYLTRADSALNLHWEKYYGGDANYALWGILATRDEGCLMYGTLYDKDPQRLKRDIYVLKVNKDGVLVSTDESSSPKVKEIILFPNPGADKVFIRTGLKEIVFELFDLNGRCMLRQEIGQATATADVSRLPCGFYLYRFTQSGRILDRGKWVKR